MKDFYDSYEEYLDKAQGLSREDQIALLLEYFSAEHMLIVMHDLNTERVAAGDYTEAHAAYRLNLLRNALDRAQGQ